LGVVVLVFGAGPTTPTPQTPIPYKLFFYD